MRTLTSDEILSLLAAPDGRAAKDALRATGSVDSILSALATSTGERETCVLIDVLGERHERSGVGPIVAYLGDERARVRFAAADALAKIGDPAAGGALLARLLLPEPDVQVNRMLMLALGALRYREAIPELIRRLDHPHPQQRESAAWALGELDAADALAAVTEAYATERNARTASYLKSTLQKLARLPRP